MRVTRKHLYIALFVVTLGWQSGVSAQQGGIEVLAPEMLFSRGIRVSLSGITRVQKKTFRGANDVTDPLRRRFEERTAVLGIDYGLRADMSLSLLVPYTHRQLRSGGSSQSAEGVGDAAFLAKYRVWKTDWFRSAAHVAVFGGVQAPTGNSRESEGGVRLPQKIQPGRGAWNPIVGFSANIELDRLRFDYTALYKFNQPGTGTRRGDFFATEIDAAYRFWHEPYPGPSASIKVGVKYTHQSHDRATGQRVSNSGSDLIVIHPGVTFHFTPATTVKFSYDFPLYRDYGGTQLAFERRFSMAFGIRF
ncbi:MAG: transporter [Planctomycetota bacterium]